MDIIDIENRRLTLLLRLDKASSSRRKLLLLDEFILDLLLSNNQNLINSYLLEFSEVYAISLSKWNAFYLPPGESEKIIEFADLIKTNPAFNKTNNSLEISILRIASQIADLKIILEGKNELNVELPYKIHFPVIEEDASDYISKYSYLESVTVKISKGQDKNRFIIIPSIKVIDDKLESQIGISWAKALEIIKKYQKRTHPCHDVVINFDQKLGEYVGNSLGIALTLAFLQELFSFYNTPIKLKIYAATTFTGGVNSKGDIIPILKTEYIKSKIKCVFFSSITKLIVHRDDEEIAKNELNKYLQEYPDRNLKIIGVEVVDDLINRRDIIDIKKQNPVIRTGKFIRKQKIAVIILMISLLGFLYANIDFDNNPAAFNNINNIVQVLNKNGRVLWEQKILYKKELINSFLSEKMFERTVDINNDGKNEVLLAQSVLNGSEPNNKMGWVACFNYKGELIWKNQFTDSSKTYKDIHTITFINHFIGIQNQNNRKIVYLFANNQPLYPAVIYKLDALTGKKLPGTFWHSGHIESAILSNFDNHGDKITALAISNCYERSVIFSIKTKSLNGQGPANKNYKFEGVSQDSSLKYVLLPKTDLTNFDRLRFNKMEIGALNFIKEEKQFDFSLIEGDKTRGAGISYLVDPELKEFKIFIGDKFQVERDTMVAKGLLPKPYSNTKEYINILKKQIKYWDGEEFKRIY